jgi:hypothetical protein
MAVIQVRDLAYGLLRSPDLNAQEEFLTVFGMVRAGAEWRVDRDCGQQKDRVPACQGTEEGPLMRCRGHVRPLARSHLRRSGRPLSSRGREF